jgi:uncharacterized protein (TIGR02598 family)
MNKQFQNAFSLIEVLISIGVAGFCLIALLGLIPTGLNKASNTVRTTEATLILGFVDGDLRTARRTASNTLAYNIAIPAHGTNTTSLFFNERGNVVPQDVAKYASKVTLIRDAVAPTIHCYTQVWWPASVTYNNGGKMLGSVEANTAIPR